VVNDVVEDGGVEDGGGVELFAGNGGADDSKNARANDGANAEGGQRNGAEGFAEPVLRFLGVGNELVDGFTGKSLVWQSSTPLYAMRGV
jgi:hypothetical protein